MKQGKLPQPSHAPKKRAEETQQSTGAAENNKRLPYTPPTIEVIEVQTERGYAGSRASNSPWGGSNW